MKTLLLLHLLAASVSGKDLLKQLLVLAIVGVVIGIAIWWIGISPMIPKFKQILIWLCYGVAALFLINFLWGLISEPFITFF